MVSLFVSLPSARWLEGRSLLRATFHTAFWMRLGYLPLVLLPLLFSEAAQTWLLPLLVVLMAIPGAALAIAFNAMRSRDLALEIKQLRVTALYVAIGLDVGCATITVLNAILLQRLQRAHDTLLATHLQLLTRLSVPILPRCYI